MTDATEEANRIIKLRAGKNPVVNMEDPSAVFVARAYLKAKDEAMFCSAQMVEQKIRAEQAEASVAELVAALEKVGTINPILQPVNEHTERIWKSIVSVRPDERRYLGGTLTGANAKAIRDLINKHKKVA